LGVITRKSSIAKLDFDDGRTSKPGSEKPRNKRHISVPQRQSGSALRVNCARETLIKSGFEKDGLQAVRKCREMLRL
jgi:hypothetical protein